MNTRKAGCKRCSRLALRAACVLLAAPGRCGGRARGGLGGRRREHRRSDVLLGALRTRCAPAASQKTLFVAWMSQAATPQPTRPHGGGLLCVGVAHASGVSPGACGALGAQRQAPRAAYLRGGKDVRLPDGKKDSKIAKGCSLSVVPAFGAQELTRCSALRVSRYERRPFVCPALRVVV